MTPDNSVDIVPVEWTNEGSIIKVLGVGGGGCNAVNYMYGLDIKGCSFVVANTNAASLAEYDVPQKIQLGHSGLGAGTKPTEGRNAALETQEEIAAKVLDTRTEMLFITAGMGGGTGTGAAPVIARMAKDRGILTVAVVTIPFRNEGAEALSRALHGIYELESNTDAILVIDNEKLYKVYGDILSYEAFPKTDEVLATAVRGIIEVISRPGYIDVDFQDVSNVLRNAGMVLMGSGEGSGPGRIEEAVTATFESPLLSDYDLKSAQNILINITSGKNEHGLRMSDLEKIDEMIEGYVGTANHFKKGIVWDDDPAFADKVRITAIVTGLELDLSGLDKKAHDNTVIIDDSFEWEQASKGGKVRPDPSRVKIDRGSGKPKPIDFGDKKPSLCVKPGDNTADLENIPSIRRGN